MKKIFNSLFVIVASMVTFAGCQKEENNAPAAGETKTVQFFANSIETKTAFGAPDGKTYPTLWTENDEQVKILLNLNEEAVADVEISDDFTTASFIADVELGKTNPSVSPYQFAVISPATAYLGKTDARFAVTIPTTQTPLVNSVDEAAQILYAVSESYEQIPGSVNLVFKHFTAYGNLSFTNLNLGDAVVQSVAITSSVGFANRWNYFPGTGVFEPNSAASTITLSTSNTENLWFACAPVGDMNGKELTFTINTNKGPLSKTVTLSGDNYKFEAGKIAKMTVNMAGIEFAKPKVYELVTSADDLTPESEIIIVATEFDQAMSTTQNNNNRAQASITKSSDKSTITDPGNDVQVLIVGEGSTDGTISLSTGEKYLYAPGGGGNYLKETTTLDANASWIVSITDAGVATIKANRSDRNWIRYNSTNNPPIFSCYTSGQTDVAIYKLQGTGTTPLPNLAAPVVEAELNEDETGIDVSWSAITNATSYVISGAGDDVTTTDTSYSFEELEPGTYNITVKAVADGYKSSTSTAVSVVVPTIESGDEGEDEEKETVVEIVASGLGIANGVSVGTLNDGLLVFAKGGNTNGNDPKYYTSGTNIRMYEKNTLTVTAPEGNVLTSIIFTITGSYDNLSASTGNYHDGSWSGNSDQVVFTNTSSSQTRFTKIVITYKSVSGNAGGETPDPGEPETPEAVTLKSIAVSGQKTAYNVGDAFDKPTVTATYSDESTKTVTDAAVFNGYNLSAAGTQPVTVQYTEEGVTVSTTFSITVTGATATKSWKLVTDASTLKSGDKLAIVSTSKGKIASATISSSIMGEFSVTITNNSFATLPSGAAELTLGGSSGAWTLTNASGTKLGATAVKKVAWDSGTTTWAITIASNGDATIQSTTSSYGRFLHNVNSTRFTTYTSAANTSMLLPQLYRYE